MSRSPYDDPPGFWTFFFAVLAALIVHDLLRLAIAAAGLSLAVGAFSQASKEAFRQTRSTSPLAQQPRQVPQLPYLNGPVSALRWRDDRACINGRVAIRLDNGWRQLHDQQCEQAAP